MKNYLYDSNRVRYELYQTNAGKAYNWLFLPGGPGIDSSYFHSLVDELTLPGNVWWVDLPGGGSNVQEGYLEDFDQWLTIIPSVVQRFEHPILVGHSAGGMLPLLLPELEHYLTGFVLLNSAPVLWMEAAVAYAKQFAVPDISQEMREFVVTPNQQTFNKVVDACMPYYFPKQTLEKGSKWLSQVPFPYPPAVWWQKKVTEMNFSARWIPQRVPTLIIGAHYDCMCPFALFKQDKRFQRPNIKQVFIEDAGHMSWIENPSAVKDAVNSFLGAFTEIDRGRKIG